MVAAMVAIAFCGTPVDRRRRHDWPSCRSRARRIDAGLAAL